MYVGASWNLLISGLEEASLYWIRPLSLSKSLVDGAKPHCWQVNPGWTAQVNNAHQLFS